MNIDVGARLRYVRMQRGLSQRALAKQAGVTNSSISLIEANEVNPSVGVLKRILDGIPISLSEFFAFEPEKPRQFSVTTLDSISLGVSTCCLPAVALTTQVVVHQFRSSS